MITSEVENKIIPMQHQSDGIDAIIDHFYNCHSDNKYKNRGKIIMPPGSGKTYLSLWTLEKMRNLFGVKRTIITVPNLILQGQIFRTFYSEFSSTHKFICIGSAKDIKDGSVEGVEVTTKPNEIKSFLNSNLNSDVIVIVTYQSVGTVSKICKKLNFGFNFGIIDESHHTVGSQNKHFSKILFDKTIKIQKRLFLTATEKIYNGKNDEVIAMNNLDYYGETICNYSLPKAIEDNVLCDYKIATIYSTDKEIRNFLKSNSYIDYKNIGLPNRDKQNILCAVLATIKVIRENGCKKIVTYHSTVKKAKIFQQIMEQIIGNNLLNIGAFHINGVNQPMKERLKNLNDFQDSFISILTNSQALVEGIDMPCIDCIVFADKKESTIQIVQAVGRALRKFYGKSLSCIVVPILTTSENDIDMFNPEFAGLLNILISLSIIDHRLMKELKSSPLENIQKRILDQKIELDNKFNNKINNLLSNLHLKVWRKVEGYLSYEDARTLVHPLKLKNMREWKRQYVKSENFPINIPKSPDYFYADNGWKGWQDFLGNEWKLWMPFEQSKKFVQKLKFKTILDWKKYCKSGGKPKGIPFNPNKVYKEWTGWGDFLGAKKFRTRGKMLSFSKARDFARNLKFKNTREWNKYCMSGKKPNNIPANPNPVYKNNGWKGYTDFLGTNHRLFKSYTQARSFVKKLKIKNHTDWIKYAKTKKRPKSIPSSPYGVYKNKGWKSWIDFLGNDYHCFKSYNQSRLYVRKLKMQTAPEWFEYWVLNKPTGIPARPQNVYKNNGWKGWNDFLGRKTYGRWRKVI